MMSSVTSFDASKSKCNLTMESKHYKMKKLITAIQDYIQTRNDDSSIIITRYLQALAVTIDLSIFDPHTNIAAEFFVSLYELMNRIEPRSPFAWPCVDVLSNACRNPAARHALIHTYQFIPSLSRLLGDQLTNDKKIRLLKLMQDLTCGIKISWQIPHLPHLMSTLAKWVESQNDEIITLSLGVLVNLCYNNLPAIYTLSRNIDMKRFIRICMPLQGPIVEVHTCKLLVILDYMNGDIPKSTLIKLVHATFKSVIEAFRAADAILLRQIVEFFLDVKRQTRESETLLSYEHYGQQLKLLFEVIENPSKNGGDHGDGRKNDDPESMALIFEFIHSLIELKVQETVSLYPVLIRLALNWMQCDIVSSSALSILRTIAIDPAVPEKSSLLEPLVMGLPVFILSLRPISDEMPTHIEHNKKIGMLLQLLRAMMQVDTVRQRVLQELKEEMLYKVFVPLLGEDNSPRLRANDVDTCSTEAVNMYVYAVALVNELAKYDAGWINLQNNLLQHKQIHMVLAQGLYNSPTRVKKLILEMASISVYPGEMVAEAMSTLHNIIHVDSSHSRNHNQQMNDLNFPVLSVAQIARLDEVLHKLKGVIAEKNLLNLSTSDVMELYEYKLASMGHAERAALASVEAASERCTHLQHRTAQLTAEQNRLHQLLFYTQQCHEQALKSKDSLEESNRELKNCLDAEKGRYVACSSQLKLKEQALAACEAKLNETMNSLNEVVNARNKLEEQHNKLKQVVNKLGESSTRLEKNIEKKDEQIRKANMSIETLKFQVNELENLLRQREAELLTKNNELEEVTKELLAKRQIIETITKVASSQYK